MTCVCSCKCSCKIAFMSGKFCAVILFRISLSQELFSRTAALSSSLADTFGNADNSKRYLKTDYSREQKIAHSGKSQLLICNDYEHGMKNIYQVINFPQCPHCFRRVFHVNFQPYNQEEKCRCPVKYSYFVVDLEALRFCG